MSKKTTDFQMSNIARYKSAVYLYNKVHLHNRQKYTHTTVTCTQKAKVEDHRFQCLPWLQNRFKANTSDFARLCLKMENKDKKKKGG